MAQEIHILPSADSATPRQVRAVTTAFAIWAVLWAALASWVAYDVGELARISDEALATGRALGRMAAALGTFAHTPFVGTFARAGASELLLAAASLRSSGLSSRDAIGQLSILLGLAVALIPVLPFGVLLARLHRERRRERGALERALASGGRERENAICYLAGRGYTNLPYHELVGPAGGGQDTEAIARAELERLGLGRYWSEPAGAGTPGEGVRSGDRAS